MITCISGLEFTHRCLHVDFTKMSNVRKQLSFYFFPRLQCTNERNKTPSFTRNSIPQENISLEVGTWHFISYWWNFCKEKFSTSDIESTNLSCKRLFSSTLLHPKLLQHLHDLEWSTLWSKLTDPDPWKIKAWSPSNLWSYLHFDRTFAWDHILSHQNLTCGVFLQVMFLFFFFP